MSNKYYYLNTEKESLKYLNTEWQSCYGKTDVIKGVVLHDSAGSMNATAESVAKYTSDSIKSNPDNANYHDVVDDNGNCYAVIPMTQRAYHTGDVTGNKYYIGIEIAPSLASGDFKNQDEKEKYYKAWKNACKLVADYLCYYNLTSNDVFQHNYFINTACPYTMTKYFGSKEKALSETKKQVSEFMKIVKGEVVETNTDEKIYAEIVEKYNVFSGPDTVIKITTNSVGGYSDEELTKKVCDFPKDTFLLSKYHGKINNREVYFIFNGVGEKFYFRTKTYI